MRERQVIDKVMSLSRTEFTATMAHLGIEAPSESTNVIAVENGTVEVRYLASEGVRLGGLLSLPRAIVRLTFDDVSEADRAAFLARFDRAFQRGGG